MRFHYDLTQAEPIIRDYPVYDSSATGLLNGMAMARLADSHTAANRCFMQKANPATLANIVGVMNETGLDASSSAVATGVAIYGKLIINPMAVWYCEYSQHADNDTVNTSASTGGKVTTAAFTQYREADWIYYTGEGSTTGGAGNLAQIGASTSTTSVTAVIGYDDNMNTTNTSDTFIVITAPFNGTAAGGGLDLSAVTAEYGCKIKGVAATGAGALLTLANYIESAGSPSEQVLRVQQHSGYNYPYKSTRIYADAFLLDHLLLGGDVAAFPIT